MTDPERPSPARGLSRSLLGVVAMLVGYSWLLALLYYLFVRPDWGLDARGFARGLPVALLVTVYGTHWLMGRDLPALRFLHSATFYLIVGVGCAATLVAYLYDLAHRPRPSGPGPALYFYFLDGVALLVLARLAWFGFRVWWCAPQHDDS